MSFLRHAFKLLSVSRLNRPIRDFGALQALMLAACMAIPGIASADGIGGTIELSYTHSDQTFKSDADRQTLDVKGDIFRQRYRLYLDRTLYPNLTFSAAGVFDHTKLWSTTEIGTFSEDSTASDTKVIPTVDLKLNTPFITAAVGYNMFRESFKSNGESLPDNIRESYYANLGLRPEGLPQVNGIFTRNNLYDEDRLTTDRVEDTYILTLKYQPRQELDLLYAGTYSELDDKLNDLKVNEWIHSGRVSFSKEFFRRVAVNTSYNGIYRETEVVHAGKGIITSSVLPFAGLSVLSNTPLNVALDQNPALIDGDLLASGGINIGPVSGGGNADLRNMGLDFFNESELNLLDVWVDRELPAVVSQSFTWAIYISSDNLNWSLYQTVSPAPFGSFANRFEISFPKVKTRYIKVVVRPLSSTILPPPGFDVSSIFVTELQAFLTVPAADVKSNTSDNSHIYALDVRTRILDSPSLVHNLSYWRSWGSQREATYVLSNALSINHRFSRIFSGSARTSMDISETATSRTTSYVYGAALMAYPLPTLSHTLLVSGRTDEEEEGTSTSESIFLSNWAELYRGINLSLVGGYSQGTDAAGKDSKSTTASAGLSLVPRGNLTINADYTVTNSEASGGGTPDSTNDTRSLNVSVSYQPFDTLYLFGTVSHTTQTDEEPSTTQSYSASWAPFRGGTLQISIGYTEDLRSTDNARITTFGPSVRWNINYRTSLDLAYNITKEESDTGLEGTPGKQENKLKALTVLFRTMF